MKSASGLQSEILATNQGVRGRKGVQQEDVSRAADAILAAGARPTVERVRAHLGTGSPNTVAPMLESWFKGLAVRVAGLPAGPSADGLPAAAQNAFRLMWDTAMQEAREAASAELAEQRSAVQAQGEQLVLDARALEASRSAMEQALRLAEKEAAQHQARSEQVAAALQRTESRLEEASRQIEALRSELAAERQLREEGESKHRADLERERDRGAGTERRLLAEVDRAREETRRAERAAAAASDAGKAALAKLETAQAQALQLTQKLATAEQQAVRAESAVAQASLERAAMQVRLEAAEARADDLAAAMAAQRSAAREAPKPLVARRLASPPPRKTLMRQPRG